MATLSLEEQRNLRTRLKKEMKREILLTLYTVRSAGLLILPGRECETCSQTQELLSEVVQLSSLIKLEQIDFYTESQTARENDVERIPCITLTCTGSPGSKVRFFGIPAGYGFSAFIEALVTMSKDVSPLQLSTRKALRKIDKSLSLKVFVTPNCTYSPMAARLAQAIALENPKIRADVIATQEFPYLAQQYGIRSVPRTFINDMIEVQGVVSESVLLNRILLGIGRKDLWDQTGFKSGPGIPSGPTTPIR